jgi:hypothetical protein
VIWLDLACGLGSVDELDDPGIVPLVIGFELVASGKLWVMTSVKPRSAALHPADRLQAVGRPAHGLGGVRHKVYATRRLRRSGGSNRDAFMS